MGSILPRPERGEPRDLEDDGTLCPLERLPSGLLWDIMEHAPMHVFKLRMASPLLHYRVDQYVRLERNLPVVQVMKFTRADKSALLGVVMWFSRKYPLFKLRLLLTQPTGIISRLYRLRTGFFKLKFDIRKADLPVLEHIARYMGKRMDKVVINDQCDDADTMSAIWTFVKGKQFSSLELVSHSLTDDAVFFASKIIDFKGIDHFTLRVDKVDLGRPIHALKLLASRVRTLLVFQNDVTGIEPTDQYFFGLHDADWVPTIRAIFEGGVDTLYMKNNYPFLTNDNGISLALHLPRTKKHLYFAASYAHDDALPGDKDYAIEVKTIRGGKALKIAHSSRENIFLEEK